MLVVAELPAVQLRTARKDIISQRDTLRRDFADTHAPFGFAATLGRDLRACTGYGTGAPIPGQPAVDLLDPQAMLTALVEELDALAARLECKAVRSLVHSGMAEVRSGLSAAVLHG